MKGQTIIELKDVKTGKIEKYVDNNMMTNAIAEMFKTRGLVATTGLDRNNLMKQTLGGIVLFDKVLEESVNTLQPPSDVNMVGNASMDVTSSDSVTEMGSYNSNESGWQNDGSFVAVYDFGTSQANGTIACVCLTSDVGGYVGYGNTTSNVSKSTTKSLRAYQGAQNNYLMIDYRIIFADYANSVVYTVKNSQFSDNSDDYLMKTKKLKIQKRKVPLSKVNLRGTMTSWVLVNETEVTIPDAFVVSQTRDVNLIPCDDGIYIVPSFTTYGEQQTWSSGETIHIVKIDKDLSVTDIPVTNTVGRAISRPQFYFNSGYMIATTTGEYNPSLPWYRFNLSDSSSVDMPSTLVNLTTVDYFANGRVWKGNKVVNVPEATVTACNGSSVSLSTFVYDGAPLMVAEMSGNLRAYNVSLYLASINNLEQAVVKTAEKTMKISYRIMF